MGQEHPHQAVVLWVPGTWARALSGSRRRWSLATAGHLGQCCWAGTVTAPPRLLQNLWAVPGCVFYINPGLQEECRHGRLVGCAASRGTFWMCGHRSPPESPRGPMGTDVEEDARSRCWVLQRSDWRDVGTQTQRTLLLHLLWHHSPPLSDPNLNTTHLLPSPGICLRDNFPIPQWEHVFLCPGFMA